MLVGHEPDFSQLAAYLLGLPTNNAIHVRKASLTLLELDIFRAGAATLQFSLPSKLM
jgi:phosphohistidine phosphatase